MPYYGFYWDPTYFLVVIGAIICMIASAKVRTTYNKYARYASASGMTGAQAAEQILRAAGIYDVQIRHVSGSLTDHYDPRNKTLNLSDSVYASRSVAAVGVAAHECGHAIQHNVNYFPLTLRSTIVPVANIGSTLAWPLILIGLLFSSRSGSLFIQLGIVCFSFAVLFPDMQVLLFYCIPIKIKYLAFLEAALFVVAVITTSFPLNLLPVVAVLNFFIFCGGQLWSKRPRRSSKNTVNFRRESQRIRRQQEQKLYNHKCAVCGRTDTDFPELEFRYCSRCQGYHCFCQDHINNHIHFTE